MDDIKLMNIVDIELNSGNLHRSWLNHSIGTGDAKANCFGVRLFRDGEAVSLTGGSVQGFFRNSHGENIAITSGNKISGNVAYVVLPQACYNYEGQFTLAIKVINSSTGVTGTMRIVDGVVNNTNTGNAVAPTGTVPTYQEVLSVYNEMVAAKEGSVRFDEAQSLTAAQKKQARSNIDVASEDTIAPTYSEDEVYDVGTYCFYNGSLYRCKTEIATPEPWTSSHWKKVVLGPDVGEVADSIRGDIAPTYSTSEVYAVGDYRYYKGVLYRCIKKITTPKSWSSTDWEEAVLGPEVNAKVDELKRALDLLPWKELYDKTKTTNGYINTQGEIVTVNAQGWHISDYIPITSSGIYAYSGLTTVGVSPSSAYYKSNKSFISPVFKQATGENTLLSIPQNAKYVRFSINDNDLNTFSFRLKQVADHSDLSELHDEIFDSIPTTIVLNSITDAWTKKGGYIATQAGWSENASYDSYYFIAQSDSYIYCTNIPAAQYLQLCVYPSGEFGDARYARYRASDNNLPSSTNKLSITAGTMIIVSATRNSSTFEFKYDYNRQEIKGINGSKYHVIYDSGVLRISGFGLGCYFSDATFDATSGGLFELQALTINDCLIFGTENDYIGPIKIRNESIIGAKHGGETTDSIKIFADGTEVVSGTDIYADTVSIYVTSHINTRFTRVSTYNINVGRLSASSLFTQIVDANVENIFGAGIISSYDDSTVAWINDYLLSAADTTGNLGNQTIIATKNGNIISRRTQNKSPYTNSPVYFLTYSGRKKLYYYNTYRLQSTDLPAGSVYSSAADLLW